MIARLALATLGLAALLALAPVARADYSLPPVGEQAIVVVREYEVVDEGGSPWLVATYAGKKVRLRIDLFWWQDRIYSDGICTGDESASKERLAAVRAAAKPGGRCRALLVEAVRTAGKDGKPQGEWFCAYAAFHDPTAEHAKVCEKKTGYDTPGFPAAERAVLAACADREAFEAKMAAIIAAGTAKLFD